jgi:hypothetical protein
MRGAFVVQLQRPTSGGKLDGSVEEVDTGRQARFRSEEELIAFLRECLAQVWKNDQQMERNE